MQMQYIRLWLAAISILAIAVQPAAAEKRGTQQTAPEKRAIPPATAEKRTAQPVQTERRVALVIGNSAYVNAGKLGNPANDATDAAQAFQKFGFNVILGTDLKRAAFQEKVRAFSHALAKADTALFFYAGHGLQVGGHNYLVPVDAKLGNERDIDFEAISLDFILKQMEVDRDGKSNIVFLDACRDNPLSKNLARSMGTRSANIGKGLAEVQTGVGTFISYSTQPGNVALDGSGRNSPFTGAFKKRVMEPGRDLTAIMIDVRKDVLAATGGQQVPWDHSALTAEFYFLPGKGRIIPPAGPAPAAADPSDARDMQAAASAPAPATFDDLDALAASQNWAELHDRLNEISPSSRNAHWNELVEQAAVGELAAQAIPGGSAAERFAALERYFPKFPSLAKSEKFLSIRTKVGLQAFARCFDEGRNDMKCRNDLERFMHAAPPSAELATGAGRLIGVKFNRQAATSFYALGVETPGGEAICSNGDFQYDLIQSLEMPPDYPEAKAARDVALKCWNAVQPKLAANMAKVVGDTYYLHNACPALIQHGTLKGLLEQRCLSAIKQ
jgi:hypothetical protein